MWIIILAIGNFEGGLGVVKKIVVKRSMFCRGISLGMERERSEAT